MRALLLSLAAIAAACTTADAPAATDDPSRGPLPPGRYIVLAPSQAVVAARQCSRMAPEPEDGWRVPDALARRIERQLPALVAEANRGKDEYTTIDLSASYRQYVGMVVGGRRIVYLNAFPLSQARPQRPDGWDPQLAQSVCDGGAGFWGVEYDPATGRFANLAANGMA